MASGLLLTMRMFKFVTISILVTTDICKAHFDAHKSD